MKLSIRHETRYAYASATRRSIQLLRVTPQTLAHQRVLQWELSVPRYGTEFFDGFGNFCTLISLVEPHDALVITASGIVDIDEQVESVVDDRLPPALYLRPTVLTRADAALRDFAASHLGPRDGAAQGLHALRAMAAAMLEHMPYTPGSTDIATDAASAFAQGRGVCQDHTHAFVAAARTQGVPARYVSGYLHATSEEHLASHAWAEAWVDGRWWVFDVSNQLFTPARHVQLAVGLDYHDAAPIRGMRVGGGLEQMNYHVRVADEAKRLSLAQMPQ